MYVMTCVITAVKLDWETNTGAASFKTLQNATRNCFQSRKKVYEKMPIHGFFHNALLQNASKLSNKEL